MVHLIIIFLLFIHLKDPPPAQSQHEETIIPDAEMHFDTNIDHHVLHRYEQTNQHDIRSLPGTINTAAPPQVPVLLAILANPPLVVAMKWKNLSEPIEWMIFFIHCVRPVPEYVVGPTSTSTSIFPLPTILFSSTLVVSSMLVTVLPGSSSNLLVGAIPSDFLSLLRAVLPLVRAALSLLHSESLPGTSHHFRIYPHNVAIPSPFHCMSLVLRSFRSYSGSHSSLLEFLPKNETGPHCAHTNFQMNNDSIIIFDPTGLMLYICHKMPIVVFHQTCDNIKRTNLTRILQTKIHEHGQKLKHKKTSNKSKCK